MLISITNTIHLVQRGQLNCWIIAEEEGLTLVDSGVPAFWREVGYAIREIGRDPRDIKALLLTHGHFDHMGFADKIHRRLGTPVYIHPGDQYLAAHPYSHSHENTTTLYPLRYPASWPNMAAMFRDGAAWVRGTRAAQELTSRRAADCPGSPVVIPVPGHTDGSVALHLPNHDVIFTGDALVTLDPYTGQRGPRIIAGAATKDSSQALESLTSIAETEATWVLPGHGQPWSLGSRAAVDHARSVGPR